MLMQPPAMMPAMGFDPNAAAMAYDPNAAAMAFDPNAAAYWQGQTGFVSLEMS